MAQADRTAMVMAVRTRFTAAQVNAGATLVAAVAGMKHRPVDLTLIAIGGAASGATAVDVKGTRDAGAVTLFSAAAAALTENAVVKPDTANMTVLAAGASFTALDANTAITIIKQGDDLATATHIDAILSYATEKA